MFISIPASSPYPANAEYKISIVEELLGVRNNLVVKGQMIYDGEIAGSRSPSYPVGTDDYTRVNAAIQKIIVKYMFKMTIYMPASLRKNCYSCNQLVDGIYHN